MSKRVKNKRGRQGRGKFNPQYQRERNSHLWNCKQKGIKPKSPFHPYGILGW